MSPCANREHIPPGRIERILWPANSPDLKTIENIWAVLEAKIRQRNPAPRNLDELEVAARKEWTAITQEHMAAAIRSMNR